MALITGSDQRDSLVDTNDDDEIRGFGGDDVIYYFGGADTIDGGSGFDYLYFPFRAAGLDGVTQLASDVPNPQRWLRFDMDGDILQIRNIEEIRGTRNDDIYRGGVDGLRIVDWAGGRDTFYDSPFNDYYDGGRRYPGSGDASTYVATRSADDPLVRVSLAEERRTDSTGHTDTVIGIENVTALGPTGDTAFHIIGDDGNNILRGSSGDDLFEGGPGNGNDTILGGGGTDVALLQFTYADAIITDLGGGRTRLREETPARASDRYGIHDMEFVEYVRFAHSGFLELETMTYFDVGTARYTELAAQVLAYDATALTDPDPVPHVLAPLPIFIGTAGDDSLTGTEDNDRFQLSTGRDTIDATGGGTDFILMDKDVLPTLTVTEAPDGALRAISSDGQYDTTFRGIDTFRVSGFDYQFARDRDSYSGSNWNDHFVDVRAIDTLLGGAGDDLIEASSIDSITFDGGPGDDIFHIKSFVADVPESQFAATIIERPGEGTDTLILNEKWRYVVTRTEYGALIELGKNVILIEGEVERFQIGDQIMTLDELMVWNSDPTGTAGNDRLTGTDAANWIHGQAGNDTILASAGSDYIFGGDGTDFVDYAFAGLTAGITAVPFRYDLLPRYSGDQMYRVGDSNQHLFEVEIVRGTSYADRFVGLDHIAETQYGIGGNDVFLTSGGSDRYVGGAGIDAVQIDTWEAGVHTLSLISGRGWGGEAAGDRYVGIENIYANRGGGGVDAQFVLAGDHGANQLYAGRADDTLTGLGGNDTIDGGGGSDIAVFDYSFAHALITGDPEDLTVTYTGTDGRDGTDIVRDIEALRFTDGTLDTDTMVFTPSARRIDGTAGDDRLAGGPGQDSLYGFAGQDTLVASSGPDLMVGGDGLDWAYAQTGSRADAHLSLWHGRGWGGDFLGDRLQGIENIRTQNGDDTVIGDHGRNKIYTHHGDDVVRALAGNDYIDTGFGTDIVIFDFNRDQYEITQRNAISVVVDYVGSGTADGTNIVAHAEVLQFADGDVIL